MLSVNSQNKEGYTFVEMLDFLKQVIFIWIIWIAAKKDSQNEYPTKVRSFLFFQGFSRSILLIFQGKVSYLYYDSCNGVFDMIRLLNDIMNAFIHDSHSTFFDIQFLFRCHVIPFYFDHLFKKLQTKMPYNIICKLK